MRRIAIKLLLFLLLGAVTTVAVAWGCALYGPVLSVMPVSVGRENHPIPSRLADRWNRWSEAGGKQPQLMWVRWTERGVTTYTVYIVNLSQAAPGSPEYQTLRVRECGWPVRAMCDGAWLGSGFPFAAGPKPPVLHWSLVLSKEQASGTPTRALPMRPLVWGFMSNVIIYTGLWWIMITFAIGMRERRRMRCGFCPACAYDLRGDYRAACSECGWQRKGVRGT